MLSYLLSHATAWPNIGLRLALLASTSPVRDATKLSLVAPLIQELSVGGADTLLAELDLPQQRVYVNGLLSAFHYTAMSEIAGSMGLVFPALLKLVHEALLGPKKETILSGVPSTVKMTLPALVASQRLELCNLLISMAEPTVQVCCVSDHPASTFLTGETEAGSRFTCQSSR